MAYSVLLWLETERYRVRISAGWDFCHRGCAYTVLQTVQRSGVCSAVYDIALKSFDRSRVLSRLSASFCRYCPESESDVKEYSFTQYVHGYIPLRQTTLYISWLPTGHTTKLNQRHWRWFNVATTSSVQWVETLYQANMRSLNQHWLNICLLPSSHSYQS